MTGEGRIAGTPGILQISKIKKGVGSIRLPASFNGGAEISGK